MECTPVQWLIDTGCTCTLLSIHIFDRLSPEEQPTLQPYLGNLRSADAPAIKVRGRAMLNIDIAGVVVQHSAIIADVANDGLIGVDFLKKH